MADPKVPCKVPACPAGKREFMLNSKLKEMKKLETLNNPKYSLTPEKMGKLVGGKQVVVTSGPGSVHYPGSTTVTNYSEDTVTYANESDYQHRIVQNQHLGSAKDPVTFSEYSPSVKK